MTARNGRTPAALPNPTAVTALARRAGRLAADLDAAGQEMATLGGDTRQVGYRLDAAGAAIRAAIDDLQAAGAALARMRRAAAPGRCGLPWGVCPEHGATLVSTGGQTGCTRCARSWDYDHLCAPCTESVTHLLADAHGGTLRLCTGHAHAARTTVVGGSIRVLA